MESVEDLVDLRAWDSEHPLDVMLFERFYDDIRTCLLLTLFLLNRHLSVFLFVNLLCIREVFRRVFGKVRSQKLFRFRKR